MNSREVAELSGISVRTLHYYDEIGLLRPKRHAENDYRDYSEEDLDRLQQILFFKACGFSLEKISRLMKSPGYDRERAFHLQRKALLSEKDRLERMIRTLDKSLKALKGESTMSKEEKFEGFQFEENPYEEEARERWGDEAVDASAQHLKKLSKKEQEALGEEMNQLFRDLAAIRHEDPEGETAQFEMQRMFVFFNQRFGRNYTYEEFGSLGQMYVDDPRFTKNIDKFGEGLSEFLAKAMKRYAETTASDLFKGC